jgi:hypothetical protein
MNDENEIRRRVRAGLADGTLPSFPLPIPEPSASGQPRATGLVIATSTLPDPCAACRGRGTQFSYPNAPAGPIAFHERCHTIWLEQAGRDTWEARRDRLLKVLKGHPDREFCASDLEEPADVIAKYVRLALTVNQDQENAIQGVKMVHWYRPLRQPEVFYSWVGPEQP